MKNKKILMLTQSCNLPFFQALLGTVKNTWAKPLLYGQIPNITWFGYTACDERHPNPYVDLNDHMIYVNCGDDLSNTYLKTRTAYEMVKDIVDFDWVVRTNTSVFVNIEKMMEVLDTVDDNDNKMFAQFEKCINTTSGGIIFNIMGFFYMMSRKLFEIGMTYDYDNIMYNIDRELTGSDDRVMSFKLDAVLGDFGPYIGGGIEKTLKCYLYKPFPPEEMKTRNLPRGNFEYIYEPEKINDVTMLRVRTHMSDREGKGHEIEHFYEINDKLKSKYA